jgi:hypothetical protein
MMQSGGIEDIVYLIQLMGAVTTEVVNELRKNQGPFQKQVSIWHIHGTFCQGINKPPDPAALL